jgi:aminoglycoside phosphotransferase (APT) family kinase protein
MVLERYPDVARAIDRGPTTLLHGDPHPGNAYLVDGRAGHFDWQVMRRGPAIRDVAYCMVLSLDPPVRRAAERTLLAGWCDALASAGGPRLGVDDLWNAYRANAAYVYAAAAFTAGMRGLQPDDVAGTGLARAAAALEDLDAWRAVDGMAAGAT